MGEAGVIGAAVDSNGRPGDHPLTGILLMVAAMMVVPFMDVLAKYLSDRYGTVQLTWARFFFHFSILAPIVLYRYGASALKPGQPVLQLVRGGFTLTYTAVLGAVLMSVAVIPAWTTTPPMDLLMMASIGAIAAGGHFLLIKAFDCAPASLLAPYSYSEIVMATAVGWIFFSDFPDGWTWTGIAVIAASGIYISWRERRKNAR